MDTNGYCKLCGKIKPHFACQGCYEKDATKSIKKSELSAELAALRAERDELREALETIADPKNWLNQNGEIVWNDFEGDEFIVEHAKEIASAVLAKYQEGE